MHRRCWNIIGVHARKLDKAWVSRLSAFLMQYAETHPLDTTSSSRDEGTCCSYLLEALQVIRIEGDTATPRCFRGVEI